MKSKFADKIFINCIAAKVNIAEIQIHNDEMDISFCKLRQEKTIIFQCNTVTPTELPAFIQSDDALSEEEKEIAFMNYMKHDLMCISGLVA